MTLTLDIVEALAPDQASLKAASKQVSAKKWPLRGLNEETGLIWGECQGSGANPYRVMADVGDHGYKCTCPSRKFPCKHALALMWMFAESAGEFEPASVPDWVSDWVGRRRKSGGGAAPAAKAGAEPKSLAKAVREEPAAKADPKAEARRKAAAEKRAKETLQSVASGLDELEQWVLDQLGQGLQSFVTNAQDRCRRIAARLVDAKAQALASRLDELPARLLELPAAERTDAAMAELGKLVLLSRAWKAAPGATNVHGFVVAPPGREDVLTNDATLRVKSRWEVLGEHVSTGRDGLMAQATWLLNLTPAQGAPPFALLLDYFPAGTGRRSSSFSVGQQFGAVMAYYPGRQPLRALISERQSDDTPAIAWPACEVGEPLAGYWSSMHAEPWLYRTPMLLPAGRLYSAAQQTWWATADRTLALPLAHGVPAVALGVEYQAMAALWDGNRCRLLTGLSNHWGRIAFDG